MRTLFWNVRGLESYYRRKLVRNHILQENFDVVALQETIKQSFEVSEFREMEGKEF